MFRLLNKHHQVLKQQFMSTNDAKANTKKQNHSPQKKSQNSFISTESDTQLLTTGQFSKV